MGDIVQQSTARLVNDGYLFRENIIILFEKSVNKQEIEARFNKIYE